MINTFCVVAAELLRWLVPWIFRWEVSGLEHVPRGPALLVSNHLSVVDPPLTLLALLKLRPPRHVYFLAKASLYELRWIGFRYVRWLLNQIHAIPLRQDGADLTAFKTAMRFLGEGKLVGIYPEGGITRLAEPRAPEPGIALLAHLAQVPVIPIGISGTRPLWWRDGQGRLRLNRVKLRFGPPVPSPPRERMDDAARQAYSQRVLDACYQLVRQDVVL